MWAGILSLFNVPSSLADLMTVRQGRHTECQSNGMENEQVSPILIIRKHWSTSGDLVPWRQSHKISPRKNSTPSISSSPRKGQSGISYCTCHDLTEYPPGLPGTWRTPVYLGVLQRDSLEAEPMRLSVGGKTGGPCALVTAGPRCTQRSKSPLKSKSVMTIKNPKGPQPIKILIYSYFFLNIPHLKVNFCSNRQHSSWVSFCGSFTVEDKGMCLQLPKEHLRRGHFPAERGAGQRNMAPPVRGSSSGCGHGCRARVAAGAWSWVSVVWALWLTLFSVVTLL